MEARLVLMAFRGMFDGGIKHHQGNAEQKQETDEDKHQHGFRGADDVRGPAYLARRHPGLNIRRKFESGIVRIGG